MNKFIIITLIIFFSSFAYGEETYIYKDKHNRFSVEYEKNWKISTPTTESIKFIAVDLKTETELLIDVRKSSSYSSSQDFVNKSTDSEILKAFSGLDGVNLISHRKTKFNNIPATNIIQKQTYIIDGVKHIFTLNTFSLYKNNNVFMIAIRTKENNKTVNNKMLEKIKIY